MRRDRIRLAILFLLLASFAGPELVWAGVHALEHHHEHDAEPEHSASKCREGAPAVATLLHGHPHPEGVPEHGHELVSAPAPRLDPRPAQTAPAGGVTAALAVLAAPAPRAEEPFRSVSPPGASPPPLLHLLCTLLI